jgi:hypothetical protein
MATQKYTDYNSYISKLKYYNNSPMFKCCPSPPPIQEPCNTQTIFNTQNNSTAISNQLFNTANIKINDQYLNTLISTTEISTDLLNTFIHQPIDDANKTISMIYVLKAGEMIEPGTMKNIINKCELTTTTKIYIYSKTPAGVGGFNVLGVNFNCYSFASVGDSISLIWDKHSSSWSTLNYGGFFTNI